MDFENGKLVGNVNENGVCKNFEGKKFCGND